MILKLKDMKRIKIWSGLLVVCFMTGMLGSCTNQFEELNTDPNRLEQINPGTLLSPILYEMACFNYNRANSFTFDLMQVTLPFPSSAGGIHRYVVSETAGNSTWTTYYRWLNNVKEMEESAILYNSPNYRAIALTLRAWMYANLTDCFGDVPMREACKGDEKLYQPEFDTQQAVYEQVFADLDTANVLFDEKTALTFGGDILYEGTTAGITKWRKFANSLHMRGLLRLSRRTEMNTLRRLAVMINDPVKYPVFESNEDAALLPISGVVPYSTPIARPQDLTSYRAMAEFFVDHLNHNGDVRCAAWFGQAKDINGVSLGYKGIPSGHAGELNIDFTPSNINQQLAKAPLKIVMMSYAEVEFIKAEMAQRGFITEDAKTHYEAGIRASVGQWGISADEAYFADFFNKPGVVYDGTLERIMLQKYYGLFFCDYQMWYEYRRTGFPALPRNDGMLNNKIMPVRFKYPEVVQRINSKNYKAAVESMGGDDINTKVWWEK